MVGQLHGEAQLSPASWAASSPGEHWETWGAARSGARIVVTRVQALALVAVTALGGALVGTTPRYGLPFVFITDVIQGLMLAFDCEHAVGQAYNISNDRPLTQQQVLDVIARDIGASPPAIHIPYRVLYAAGSATEQLASLTGSQRQPILTRLGVKLFGTDNRHAIGKAKRELGYRPQVPVREGLRLTAAWYRAQDQSD